MRASPRDLVLLAGLAAAGYALWKAYSVGSDALAAAGRAADQAVAEVSQFWGNLGSVAPEGDPLKKLLYGGSNYTGLDVNGQSVVDGDLGQSPELRRYIYDYNKAVTESGGTPAVTTNNGAAFGIYPNAGKRKPKPATPS